MRRLLLGAAALALCSLFLNNVVSGQQPGKWGSLTGKVTLKGDIPANVDLVPKMMIHNDKACCLALKAQPFEKVDYVWAVDPKTKAVQNVAVWIKVAAGKEFPIHDTLKKRKGTVEIDQPHCAFIPRIQAVQPVYKMGGKEFSTGMKMVVKNSAECTHNIRALWSTGGFNINLPAGQSVDVTKKLEPLRVPANLQCDIHPWMSAKLFVFDHPYYAITKADGSFDIPIVPAGAEVTLMAWHESSGFVLWTVAGDKKTPGQSLTIKEGANSVNIEFAAPGK